MIFLNSRKINFFKNRIRNNAAKLTKLIRSLKSTNYGIEDQQKNNSELRVEFWRFIDR